MSWFKSAVNRAVEVGGRNPLGRTVKSYAGTVVYHAGQAVAGGAKILQDRIGSQNYKNFKYTAKKLEEVVVSCRGEERVELLRQLLISLRGTERTLGNSEEAASLEQPQSLEPKKTLLVLFSESDFEGDSMNFRDVFLHSQALEGIILSMILDAPKEEEVPLLLDIFGLSLAGDKEVHNAIMNSIQKLAKAFSSYHDEVLVKREELLQFAQSAISGVKLNTDLARIDAEVSSLWNRIDGMKALCSSSDESCRQTSAKTDFAAVEGLKEALAEVQLCSKLEELLLKKRSIKYGDSVETHSEKVDKLKVLAESLANSSSKAEIRISDHRHQLEDALNFRVAKAHEVSETEKGLTTEIAGLERRRDRLEAELMKVNMSLKSSLLRLNKHREERNHFDEASNQIIVHLKSKENELSRSIVSFKVEADTVHEWIKFLEETWVYQLSYREHKEKQIDDELEKYGNCFLRLIKHHLLACKEELRLSVDHIKELVDSLKNFSERLDTKISSDGKSLESLELDFLVYEGKIVTALSVVDHMKELFYAEQAQASRRDEHEVQELFDVIENMKGEFGSIERPKLELEAPKLVKSLSRKLSKGSPRATDSPKPKRTESPEPSSAKAQQLYHGAELSEFVDASGDWSNEDILGWEFDEI